MKSTRRNVTSLLPKARLDSCAKFSTADLFAKFTKFNSSNKNMLTLNTTKRTQMFNEANTPLEKPTQWKEKLIQAVLDAPFIKTFATKKFPKESVLVTIDKLVDFSHQHPDLYEKLKALCHRKNPTFSETELKIVGDYIEERNDWTFALNERPVKKIVLRPIAETILEASGFLTQSPLNAKSHQNNISLGASSFTPEIFVSSKEGPDMDKDRPLTPDIPRRGR